MRMPKTLNGLNAPDVISGLQKHIRRGEEELACQAACELLYSGAKGHAGWLLNRLVIISHEDIGLANPQAVMFTAATIDQARTLLKENKIDGVALLVANVILMLSRSLKSRLGGHFVAAAGCQVRLGKPYEIPDYAYDMHTAKGRAAKKDLEDFRGDGAKLDRVDTALHDPYEDKAYENWKSMNYGNIQKSGTDVPSSGDEDASAPERQSCLF